jgi:hypothetical protein
MNSVSPFDSVDFHRKPLSLLHACFIACSDDTKAFSSLYRIWLLVQQDERIARAMSPGFTHEYQNEREQEENCQEYRDMHSIESYRISIETLHPIILQIPLFELRVPCLLGSVTSE